jgi:hypothetical protein
MKSVSTISGKANPFAPKNVDIDNNIRSAWS